MVKQVLPEGSHHWCKSSRILPNWSDSISSPRSPTFTSVSRLRMSCMEGCSEHFCQDAACAVENGTHEHRENRNWIRNWKEKLMSWENGWVDLQSQVHSSWESPTHSQIHMVVSFFADVKASVAIVLSSKIWLLGGFVSPEDLCCTLLLCCVNRIDIFREMKRLWWV